MKAATALAAGVLVVVLATPALAAWTRTSAVTQASISSATLAPPTAFAADCNAVLGLGQVTLTWTATTSTFATGYQVWRKQGAGAWVQRATVTPRTTATYEDSLGLLTGILGTSFTYRLVAEKGAWTATAAAEPTVSVSVLGVC